MPKRSRPPRPPFTLVQIRKAVVSYRTRTGRLPTRASGDASDDFGHPEDWNNVDNALRFGFRGIGTKGSSLSKFMVAHGFKKSMPSEGQELTEGQVVLGLLSFAEAHHGRPPNGAEMTDLVRPYIDSEVTWRTIEDRLRMGRFKFTKGGSLHKLAIQAGLRAPRGVCPNLDKIKLAAAQFALEHNRKPGLRSGTATAYFGYQETWTRVSTLLRKEHGLTLRELLADMEVLANGAPVARTSGTLTEDDIIEAASAYRDEHARFPTYYSGDATSYFTIGAISWRAIDRSLTRGLRSLAGGTTLSQLLQDRGLKPRRGA